MATIFLLYKKELTCLFRDKEIIVYGVLLPLLLIPSIALLMMEGGLCYVGMTETQKTKVAIVADEKAASLISQGIMRGLTNALEITNLSRAQADTALKNGSVDAVVEQNKDALQLKLVESRDPLDMIRSPLAVSLDMVCANSAAAALAAAHLDKSLADPIKINRDYVGEEATTKNAQEVLSPSDAVRMVWCGGLALLFIETMMTAIYAIIVPIISDIEQRTLLTSLMMPVPRFAIAFSKYLAGVTTTILSAMQFCLSALISTLLMAAVMLLQLPALMHRAAVSAAPPSPPITTPPPDFSTGSLTTHTLNQLSPHMSSWRFFEFIGISTSELLLFCLALGVGCAVIFACASWARTASEAQMFISIPVLFGSMLPLISMVPDLEFNRLALAMPVLNLFLIMKSSSASLLTSAMVVGESVGLILLCVALGSYLSALRNNLVDTYRFRFWARSKNVT